VFPSPKRHLDSAVEQLHSGSFCYILRDYFAEPVASDAWLFFNDKLLHVPIPFVCMVCPFAVLSLLLG
jgi:hypothetical protein